MNSQITNTNSRLVSIDILRGLAMFLILSIDIGGAPIFKTFTRLWGENFANAASKQFSYGFGEGLRLCFIAMPMFLFIVGLVIPLSMNNRIVQKNKKGIYLHLIKRSLILFFLGLVAGGHLLHLKFANMPVYNNVLEYISVGYFVCSVLVLNTTLKAQYILTIVLLLLYWAIFLFIPVPGWQGEIFSGQMNLGIYIDNVVLGQFHEPGSCRILATISLISNMLLGVLIGHIIFSNRSNESKTKLLFIYGLVMFFAGLIWGQFYPVIRTLWTGSYVLLTCGISTLLLATFYFIIDVKGHSKWAFFFVVFGANSIAIYMMAHMFDFRLIGNIFVGGFSTLFTSNIQDFIQAVAAMTVMWLIMYWMYQKKTFIKV
jgi:predicted acyltransferase